MSELKQEIQTLDDVGENLREYYAEQDGKYILNLTGGAEQIETVPMERYKELTGELEGMKAKLERMADEKSKEMRTPLTEEVMSNEAYEKKLSELRESYDKEFKEKEAQSSESINKLNRIICRKEVQALAVAMGLADNGFAQDIYNRLRDRIGIVDGDVTVIDETGGQAFKGRSKVTIEDELISLRKRHPKFFKDSNGAAPEMSSSPKYTRADLMDPTKDQSKVLDALVGTFDSLRKA